MRAKLREPRPPSPQVEKAGRATHPPPSLALSRPPSAGSPGRRPLRPLARQFLREEGQGSRGAPPRHNPGPPALRPPLTRCPGRAAQQPQSHGRDGAVRGGQRCRAGAQGGGGCSRRQAANAAPSGAASAASALPRAPRCSPAPANGGERRLGSLGPGEGSYGLMEMLEKYAVTLLHVCLGVERKDVFFLQCIEEFSAARTRFPLNLYCSPARGFFIVLLVFFNNKKLYIVQITHFGQHHSDVQTLFMLSDSVVPVSEFRQ